MEIISVNRTSTESRKCTVAEMIRQPPQPQLTQITEINVGIEVKIAELGLEVGIAQVGDTCRLS